MWAPLLRKSLLRFTAFADPKSISSAMGRSAESFNRENASRLDSVMEVRDG